jgi:hypothetical protein
MASVFTNSAKAAFAAGQFNWGVDDFRFRLCMTNTTCDTENDGIVTLSNYTTIDVCNSGGYADIAATAEVVNKDDPNDRAECDAADVTFAGLAGNASRAIQGCLIYKFIDGTNANDLAVAYVDFTATAPATSTSITIPWSAEGILQLT